MKEDLDQKLLEMSRRGIQRREQRNQNMISSVKNYLQDVDIENAVKTIKEFKNDWINDSELMTQIDKLFKEQKIISFNCINCNSNVKCNSDEFNWRHTQMLCQTCETEIELRERRQRCKSRGIPERFLNASIEDFPSRYQRLTESNSGIYLYGPCGVGKTHLMASLLQNDVMENPVKEEYNGIINKSYYEQPFFITTPELLLKIRATFNRNDEYGEEYVLDLYSRSKILYLDDFGVEKPTEWVLQTLFLIIDRRYRNILKTVISSNYSLDEISGRLDDRIASRIAGMCEVIEMKGEDRRLKR